LRSLVARPHTWSANPPYDSDATAK